MDGPLFLKALQLIQATLLKKNLYQFLSKYLQPGDVLVTMGAGDITTVGPALIDKLEK